MGTGGRKSVFDTREEAESPSPQGLYEVKYSPERMSLLERVKEKRRQRGMYRTARNGPGLERQKGAVSVDYGLDFADVPIGLPQVKP